MLTGVVLFDYVSPAPYPVYAAGNWTAGGSTAGGSIPPEIVRGRYRDVASKFGELRRGTTNAQG